MIGRRETRAGEETLVTLGLEGSEFVHSDRVGMKLKDQATDIVNEHQFALRVATGEELTGREGRTVVEQLARELEDTLR